MSDAKSSKGLCRVSSKSLSTIFLGAYGKSGEIDIIFLGDSGQSGGIGSIGEVGEACSSGGIEGDTSNGSDVSRCRGEV